MWSSSFITYLYSVAARLVVQWHKHAIAGSGESSVHSIICWGQFDIWSTNYVVFWTRHFEKIVVSHNLLCPCWIQAGFTVSRVSTNPLPFPTKLFMLRFYCSTLSTSPWLEVDRRNQEQACKSIAFAPGMCFQIPWLVLEFYFFVSCFQCKVYCVCFLVDGSVAVHFWPWSLVEHRASLQLAARQCSATTCCGRTAHLSAKKSEVAAMQKIWQAPVLFYRLLKSNLNKIVYKTAALWRFGGQLYG